MLLLSTQITAQIEVASDGDILLGAGYYSDAKVTVHGGIDSYNIYSSQIDGGDAFGKLNIGNGPFTTFLTVWSPSSSGMGATNTGLDVKGNIIYTGTCTQSSDARMKKNIKMVNSIDLFEKFNSLESKEYCFLNRDEMLSMTNSEGISFHKDTMDLTNSMDQKKIHNFEKNHKKTLQNISGVKFIGENQVEISLVPEFNPNKTCYGFLAQDVQAVFFVEQNSATGLYSVNYIGFIPLLFQTTKELKKENDNLKDQLEELKEYLGLLDNKKVKSSPKNTNTSLEEDIATLAQNAPNPFSESAIIDYYLPKNTINASIYIYDMNGRQLKVYPLEGEGYNSISIHSAELYPGMFSYTLVANGEIIDTKRMIITE